MHPWMSEQLAYEHRRDLLARAARVSTTRQPRRPWFRGATRPQSGADRVGQPN